jgi:tetratricopeptide (TPR) repeat protein
MSTDWFRNITWDDSIEAAFNKKLSRSKLKEQYLRVQASTLAKTYPEVSLKLLERYFELPDDSYHAQAYVDRASACLALERVGEAVEAYEAAIASEQKRPQLETQVHLELPFTIAVRQLCERYDRALEVLDKYRERLLFPVDYFQWHAAKALIAADQEQPDLAGKHAAEALRQAERAHSGFDSHPTAGLVKNRFDDVKESLRAFL